MKLDEFISELKNVLKSEDFKNKDLSDIDVECSVDISDETNENTYADRCFGFSPYLIRALYDKNNNLSLQILFEKSEMSVAIIDLMED